MIIGLDVGGTHADVVLLGDQGLIKEIKVPTDPSRLFETVLTGLEKVTEGVDPAQIHRVVLSTTLTTNAIVQEKLPPVGMVVSCGPGIQPEVYRTNEHYFTVSGSIDHRGREIQPIHPEEVESIGKQLKAEGIRYAGVVGKFCTRNPEHEVAMGKALQPYVEKIFLATGSQDASIFPGVLQQHISMRPYIRCTGHFIPPLNVPSKPGDFNCLFVFSKPTAEI